MEAQAVGGQQIRVLQYTQQSIDHQSNMIGYRVIRSLIETMDCEKLKIIFLISQNLFKLFSVLSSQAKS